MECLECQCSNLLDIDDNPEGVKCFMCEDCGSEQSEIDWKYRKYKIGKVLTVEELKAPLKRCSVQITQDKKEDPLQIVTNAKHIDAGDTVVVATIGAIVPAGTDSEEEGGQGIIIKSATVGGTKSNGMLCDGVMLQWAGGSKGVLVKLNADDHAVGSTPPARKPITS